MPKLRVLSGKEVVKILSKLEFEVGIPEDSARWHKANFNRSLHDELDKGTLKAIIRQASRYIPE